ncbi:YdcF family protein [Fundidesulfovibrio agrisoli]|uniref:YdcF family protein n=1 Tax=Fundidesulfovibrio agrisoli TaxID=2922717 RepID=UPI001FAB73E5
MKRPALRAVFHVAEHLLLAGAIAAVALLLTAGYWLQAGDTPEHSDAMVVLGGDFLRPIYAAELYQLGMADKVYVGRTHRKPGERALDQNLVAYPREEEVYRAVLRKKGVPATAIEYYGDDLLSTVQEAEALQAQIGPGPGKLLVVTSPWHVRRARMIFKDVLPGWEIRVAGAPQEALRTAWWSGQESARMVMLEFPKTVYYLLGGRFRSSQSPAS